LHRSTSDNIALPRQALRAFPLREMGVARRWERLRFRWEIEIGGTSMESSSAEQVKISAGPRGARAEQTTLRALIRRAPLGSRLSAMLLVITLLTLAIPSLYRPLAFMPARAGHVLYAHTFLTYALLTGGLWECIRSALVLTLCGQVIEPRLAQKDLLALVIGSALLSSTLFLALRPGEVFIGAGPIGAGYMGAFLFCWLKDRKAFGGWARAGAIFTALAFVTGLLSGSSVRVLIATTGIAAGVFAFVRISKRPIVTTAAAKQ